MIVSFRKSNWQSPTPAELDELRAIGCVIPDELQTYTQFEAELESLGQLSFGVSIEPGEVKGAYLLTAWVDRAERRAKDLWEDRYRAEHGGRIHGCGWNLGAYNIPKQIAIMEECKGIALDELAPCYEGNIRSLNHKIERVTGRLAVPTGLRERLAALAATPLEQAAALAHVELRR